MWVANMCYHHAVCSSSDASSERNQLYLLQPFHGVGDGWQGQVRIHGCITMTGEMFKARNDACLVIPMYCRFDKAGYLLGIFTERANADHRISRIVIHVHYGSQVHIDTKRLQLPPACVGDIVRSLLQAGCSDRHISGEDGCPLPK